MVVRGRSRGLLAALVVMAAAGVFAPSAHPQGVILESGFRVKHFDTCAQGAPGQPLEIWDAACSPGGAWGNFVYFAVVNGSDDSGGSVDRIGPNGQVSGFLVPDIPVSMGFSAPQGPFEDRLWVNDARFTAGMFGVNPPLGLAPLFTCAKPNSFTFDHSGAFGYHMFVRGSDGIYRLEAPGCDPSLPPPYVLFALTGALPLEFGPGGLWGVDLYASGGEIFAPDGSSTTFPFPFAEVTWGFGTKWNGDMFARQTTSSDIFRVNPDGTSTLFAVGFVGEMVFCLDSLWIMQAEDCVKITPKGGPRTITPRGGPGGILPESGPGK